MKIPINFKCSCGATGNIQIDEDTAPIGQLLATHPCYSGADHGVYITINSLDKTKKLVSYTVSIRTHEPAKY